MKRSMTLQTFTIGIRLKVLFLFHHIFNIKTTYSKYPSTKSSEGKFMETLMNVYI